MGSVVPASTVRIGIVGYGMMGKAHCYGYRVAPMVRKLPVTPVVSVMSARHARGDRRGSGGRWQGRVLREAARRLLRTGRLGG